MKLINVSVVLLFVTYACSNAKQDSELLGDESLSIEQQAASELDWIDSAEAKAQVIELAKAGQPVIKKNSNKCQGYFSDEVGPSLPGEALCLKSVKVSGEVMSQLILGNSNRFQNESDYDQRLTKLYAFKHDGSLDRFLNNDEVAALFAKFSAKVSMNTEHGEYYFVNKSVAENDYLGSLRGLYIAQDYVDVTPAYSFTKDLVKGASVKSISAHYEIVLYPGGGWTTTFDLLISNSHIVFVKKEGWNS